jgi:hypothetical protein
MDQTAKFSDTIDESRWTEDAENMNHIQSSRSSGVKLLAAFERNAKRSALEMFLDISL